VWILPFALAALFCPPAARADAEADAREIVARYQDALNDGDVAAAAECLGPSLLMINGSFSDEPTEWQAHMYLSGADVASWPARYLEAAGPHENAYDILSVHVRAGAALVVTRDSGRNKFREWESEVVVWHLGDESGSWKIVGFFIRNVQNP